jgi:AbrB family looped-hinge helix DNA binding protein
MKEHTTRMTRKGQVTIPVAIRQALSLKQGDYVDWLIEEGHVRLRRSSSIVARTAGILKSDGPSYTTEEERAAAEQAIAEEAEQRGRHYPH